MKDLPLRKLELVGMVLLAIVDVAIIAAAFCLAMYTGKHGWFAMSLIIVYTFGYFVPSDYRKPYEEAEKAKEEKEKKKDDGKVSLSATFVLDRDEVLRAFLECQEKKKKGIEDKFLVQVNNGGATPI